MRDQMAEIADPETGMLTNYYDQMRSPLADMLSARRKRMMNQGLNQDTGQMMNDGGQAGPGINMNPMGGY